VSEEDWDMTNTIANRTRSRKEEEEEERKDKQPDIQIKSMIQFL
jgi:hypothetical protein